MSLDLNKLANKLDETLSNETTETLTKFLTNKRMSNNKQSSIEWLAEIIRFANKELYAEMFDEIEQAKLMHKKEIENAHYQGQSDEKEYWNIGDKCMNRFQRNCMEYYNETFAE